ncbi:MAG: hypothetical protein OSA99_01240 [Acidimicrobiales bacterium]|nr:hypothetical protein [Acidimicrobiales bacterium]
MDTTLTPARTLPPLLVMAWRDPVVDTLGFDPRSTYVERFWLPLLGPTSTWLLRRLASEFDDQPDGFSIDAADCARSIGIGNRGGQNGPFHRSIERCIRFGVARQEDHGIIAVRTKIPPLNRQQARRLPRHLAGQHRRWQDDQLSRNTHPANDAHATRLARSLLDVGASRVEVEEQLRRWNFDAAAANRAIASACEPAPGQRGRL